jgi:ClpP class serine protease
VRVTLIHSGQHKVEGNPYEPLPEAVREDIQREIDVLRFLFAETVAAGRAGRLSQEAALVTEAATYRGTDAVAAGLADEVTDLARGFAGFRQMLSSPPPLSSFRARRASLPQPKQEALMAQANKPDDSTEDTDAGVTNSVESKNDAAASPPATPAEAPEASRRPVSVAPAPSNLADLSVELREAAAEIAEIVAQAGRLGIAIDAAKALRDGTAPEALRKLVLQRAAAAVDARDIVAAPPSPILPKSAESPIVAAAKKAASAGTRG